MVWSILFACGPQLSATPAPVEAVDLPTAPDPVLGLTPEDGALHLTDLGRTPGVNAGIQLSDDGLWAHAGMKGFTCDIWTEDGSIAADLDYPGDGDEVIDGLDNRLLLRTDRGLFVTRFGQHTASGQVEEPFLADARLVDGGLTTLAETASGCQVAWYTQVDAPDSVTAVDDSWCTAGVIMRAERDTGTVWLLEEDLLMRVTPEGEHAYDIGGQHLAWDPVHEKAWVASTGDHQVVAVDPNGTWTTYETQGPVQALGSLAQVGALVVGTPGAVEVLWGATGETWGLYNGMVQPEGDLESSESGAVLGLQDGTSARFFLAEVL